jgi:threonyl-tRNA synthetase
VWEEYLGECLRTLLIHAESFKARTTEKALEEAEEIPGEYSIELENALVVFTTVEEGDSRNLSGLAAGFVRDLKDLVATLKPSAVVLYPYAHLSRNLARPREALEVLKFLENALRGEIREVPVYRTPFGWYKQFSINCYGHPLSELSREYRFEEGVKAAAFNECFVVGRASGTRELTPDSEHVKKLKWVLSKHRCLDVPVTRWGPSERVKELLSKFRFKLVEDAGLRLRRLGPAVIIENKLLELSESIVKELERGHGLRGERVISQGYSEDLEGSDEFLCFEVSGGIKHCVSSDAFSDHVKTLMESGVLGEGGNHYLYEVLNVLKEPKQSDFRNYLMCLRKPQLTVLSGDLRGVLKLLADLLSYVFDKLVRIELLGHTVLVLRVSQKVFEEGIPSYLNEVLNKFYDEFVLVVEKDGASWRLSAELYYVDSAETPTLLTKTSARVLTQSPSGTSSENLVALSSELLGPLEVLVYALIDRAHKMELAGKTPYIPAFLMPTQVKIIPVSKNLMEYAELVASKLREAGVGVDVDSREVSLGRKIRDAGIEWIEYIVVVGEREKESGTVNVRVRSAGLQKSMKIDEFLDLLKTTSTS